VNRTSATFKGNVLCGSSRVSCARSSFNCCFFMLARNAHTSLPACTHKHNFTSGRDIGGDYAVKRVMTKRSTDMGETWSPSVVIPGTWEKGWCVGQPTCSYDATRQILVLQYQNSEWIRLCCTHSSPAKAPVASWSVRISNCVHSLWSKCYVGAHTHTHTHVLTHRGQV
jgi:hypothetical protein